MPDLLPIASLAVPAVAPVAPTPGTPSSTDVTPDGVAHPSFEQHLRSALGSRHPSAPRSGRSESSPRASDDDHDGETPAAASDDNAGDGSAASDTPAAAPTATATAADVAGSVLALLGQLATPPPLATPSTPMPSAPTATAAATTGGAATSAPLSLPVAGVNVPQAGSNPTATGPNAQHPAAPIGDLPTTLMSAPASAAAPATRPAAASASPAIPESTVGASAPTTPPASPGGERVQAPVDGRPGAALAQPPVASDVRPGSTLVAGATPPSTSPSAVAPDVSALATAAATASATPVRPSPSGAALADHAPARGVGALEQAGSSAGLMVADPAQSAVASQTGTDPRQLSDGQDRDQPPVAAGAPTADQVAASLSTAHAASPLASGPDPAPAPDVASQIAHQADLYRLPNGRGVRIQLHPDDLGGVDVTLRYLPSGGVQLHIAVEHAATGQLVQDGWSDLRDALAAQGITPDRLVMSVSAPSAGNGLDLSFNGRDAGGAHPDLAGLAGNGGQSNQSQQHSARQHGGSSSRGWSGLDSDVAGTTSDDTSRGATAASSRIDYRV